MTWNHRVVKYKKELIHDNEDPHYYGIVEAYYNKNNEVWGITQQPSVISDSLEDLRQTLEWMIKCLDHPVIDSEEPLAECPFDNLTEEELEMLAEEENE